MASGENFTISKATPSNPSITVNGSASSTNTITNQSVLVNATIPATINNQLSWNVDYYFPNGTLTTFNTTTTTDSNSFAVINTPLSTYNFTVNTTGNANYTAVSNIANVTDNVYQAFINLLYYNLNASTVAYPNVTFWNITPNYNASNNITLNVSIVSASGHEVFSANISNGVNTTLNNLNSTLAYGSLSAQAYTIYFNASDALGNYFTNSTTFTIAKGNITSSLGSCTNFTYNGSNCTETAAISTYNNQITGNFNVSVNNGTFTNIAAITSGSSTSNESNASFYNYTFNASGNTNYTTSNLQINYTISKATPYVNLTTNLTNFTYNGTPFNFTALITTYQNQLNGTLWVNGGNISVTNTTVSYLNATAGTFVVVFNATGNNNYIANTTTFTYMISKATPSLPELLINGSNTTFTILNNSQANISSTNVSNPNSASYLNQLTWDIYYYYPNGTLNSTPFNNTNINASNNFTPNLNGTWEFTINTTGNVNYTALNTYNITLTVNPATFAVIVSWYNTTATNVTYPNVPDFNVTGQDNYTFSSLTLNASLVSYTADEIYNNASYVNNTNASINLTYGSLTAGTYTIYFNVSDNNGNFGVNTTTFKVNQSVPNMSLIIPSTYTYNNTNDTIYANNTLYETSGVLQIT